MMFAAIRLFGRLLAGVKSVSGAGREHSDARQLGYQSSPTASLSREPDQTSLRGIQMSTEPTKSESKPPVREDAAVETVPEGTFAGTREKPVEVKEGERIPDDTGDQGGGQN
jgi:hypothetical protein